MDPERLRRAAAQFRTARPELAPLVTAVEESILAGLAALGELPAVPVHGDLKPNHLLLDGERVVLLDLDKFAAGEPMLDVTNLLYHLRRGGSWVTEAFVEEYFAHVPAVRRTRLPL
jgi:aminoglycoside phosphotransferase (APT) family kinase protein